MYARVLLSLRSSTLPWLRHDRAPQQHYYPSRHMSWGEDVYLHSQAQGALCYRGGNSVPPGHPRYRQSNLRKLPNAPWAEPGWPPANNEARESRE